MNHPFLEIKAITQPPHTYLQAIGEIFKIFDEHSQDSGNIAYGLQIGRERYFIKTAGDPDDPRPFLPHPDRVALLKNAIRLRQGCDHPALPRLHHVVDSPHGPLLIYDWLAGELIGADRTTRNDPNSAFQRFRRLPVPEILQALDVIFDLHHQLALSDWIAVDFYDGCLIYDFTRQTLSIMDLDMYQVGPFTNTRGRMFGSSRFMAPEEFELNAPIDQLTNVFTMGRTATLFLSDGTLNRSAFRGNDRLYDIVYRACTANRAERRAYFGAMADFYAAWAEARADT